MNGMISTAHSLMNYVIGEAEQDQISLNHDQDWEQELFCLLPDGVRIYPVGRYDAESRAQFVLDRVSKDKPLAIAVVSAAWQTTSTGPLLIPPPMDPDRKEVLVIIAVDRNGDDYQAYAAIHRDPTHSPVLGPWKIYPHNDEGPYGAQLRELMQGL